MTAAHRYANWVLDPKFSRETGRLIKLAAQRFLNDLKRTDIYFDETEAVTMCDFCEDWLCQWEGDFEGEPLKFQDWQRFHLEQVFGWIRKDTGTRRFDEVYIQIAKKNGKALDINTPIPTPKGWRTMYEIKVGDYVFDEQGLPVQVTRVSEIMHKESYELEFYGGCKIVASGDHLWHGETNDWRIQKNFVSKRVGRIIDTDTIFKHYQGKIGGHNIIHVPNTAPVQYPLKQQPIHPYLLGVWLGDGHSAGPIITGEDDQISLEIESLGYKVKCRNEKRKGRAKSWKIGEYGELIKIMRGLHLINNKHIPKDYLQGSIDQRMELLRGLMDTDGTVSKSGQCTYTGISRVLVYGVYELCLSLGIKATMTTKISRCQNGATALAYNVNFFEDRPVFKLERKLQRLKKSLHFRSKFRTIRSITPIGKRYVKCITVNNESHLYLAGEHFIPTHNSTESAGLAEFHLFGDRRIKTPKVFTAANNEEQAKIAVNMAGRMCEFSPALIDMTNEGLIGLMRYKENITEVINYENNGFIKALTKESSDKKSKTAGGKHGINASLGIVDEFGMSPDHGASKAIKTSMASRRERLMFYITTAGFNLDGPCYRELRKVGIDVLEGTIEKDNYLPIIYEIDLPKDEDGKETEITAQWLKDNEWCWRQANPNLDVSVNREFLRGILDDAITYGGGTEVEVMTLNFNRWMHSAETFIPADIWDKNTHNLNCEPGEYCFGGLEVGPSGEMSAMALLFPGEKKVKMFWFLAESALKTNDFYREHRELIHVDAGNEVEVEWATGLLIEEISQYQMHSFCFPNTMKNNSIVQGLIKAGIIGNPISQGLNGISSATDEWEKMIRAGEVEHFGDPILKWMNSNCLAIRKEGGTRIEKNPKVIGIYAVLNAISQWKTIDSTETNDKLVEFW